ncbi:MAG: hypothetical protein ACYC65_15165 [Candidatus Limnocylindrales bacterium]
MLADLDHRLGLGTLGFSTGRPDAAYGDGESERVIGAWLRERPEAARAVAVSSSYLGLAEPNELPWAGCVSARDRGVE